MEAVVAGVIEAWPQDLVSLAAACLFFFESALLVINCCKWKLCIVALHWRCSAHFVVCFRRIKSKSVAESVDHSASEKRAKPICAIRKAFTACDSGSQSDHLRNECGFPV
jgi:uncharacterized protein YcsI (UPF0317 family)